MISIRIPVQKLSSELLDCSYSSIRTLQDEVRIKNRFSREIVSFGIAGLHGTGRKTLGYRFGHPGGVINVLPVRYFYLADFDRAIRRNNEVCNIALTIRGFIIDAPEDLPHIDPHYYFGEMKKYCCLLFVFDAYRRFHLRRNIEFMIAVLNAYEGHPLPECYLVRSKTDITSAVRRRFGSHMREAVALLEVEMGYYECSAKYNTNVLPLRNQILEDAIRKIVE